MNANISVKHTKDALLNLVKKGSGLVLYTFHLHIFSLCIYFFKMQFLNLNYQEPWKYC